MPGRSASRSYCRWRVVPALCRMLNDATSRQGWPKTISSDHGPLFQYHRWKANLRMLEIKEIKSLPHVPMSHPLVERLIGSIRREVLDQTFFWTVTDLENKLRDYQAYYNEHRYHSSRDGATPDLGTLFFSRLVFADIIKASPDICMQSSYWKQNWPSITAIPPFGQSLAGRSTPCWFSCHSPG